MSCAQICTFTQSPLRVPLRGFRSHFSIYRYRFLLFLLIFALTPQSTYAPTLGLLSPCLLSAQSAADAQSLMNSIEGAKSGTVSLDEVSHALIDAALRGEELPVTAETLNSDLPGIDETLGTGFWKAAQEKLSKDKLSAFPRFQQLVAFLPIGEQERAKRFLLVFEQADTFVESGNLQGMLSLSSKLAGDQRALLDSRIKSLDLLSQASSATATPWETLTFLSQLPNCGKTAKTKELALIALKQVIAAPSAQGDAELASGAVQRLITELLKSSPDLIPSTIAVYEAHIRSIIDRGASEHLLDLFRMLIELRPDPHEANIQLRMYSAAHASTPGQHDFALGRVEELRQLGQLSFGRKLRLVYSGYYGKALPILLSFLLVLLFVGGGGISYVVFVLKRKELEIADQEADFRSGVNAQLNKINLGQGRQKFSTAFGSKKQKPVIEKQDEYSRLLAFFNLDDSASESDIKKAYRDTMKNYHPDTAGKDASVSEEDQKKFFMKAKETYDRILEIRSSWFGAKR